MDLPRIGFNLSSMDLASRLQNIPPIAKYAIVTIVACYALAVLAGYLFISVYPRHDKLESAPDLRALLREALLEIRSEGKNGEKFRILQVYMRANGMRQEADHLSRLPPANRREADFYSIVLGGGHLVDLRVLRV